MISDEHFLLRFFILGSFLLPSTDGALLANVHPKVNSAVDFHSAINQLESSIPNYCNESKLIEQSGLIRAPMGQFLGFPCSNEFYHCRWQSDGYRTYKKNCRAGLVYDVLGTQNCNYDYNVKGCSMGPTVGGGVTNCTSKDFECPLSEDCVPLAKRCDGNYDCVLEEDEQNCPMCKPTHFPCVISEQCIPLGQRCNGAKECQDGTDELECENCGAGKFLCRKSGKCIAAKERCDGFAQCPHGEDEQLCKKSRIMLGPRMFVCESGKHQIPQQNVCDGVVHCPDDASDEKYCQPPVEKALIAPPPPPSPPQAMEMSAPTSGAMAMAPPMQAQQSEQLIGRAMPMPRIAFDQSPMGQPQQSLKQQQQQLLDTMMVQQQQPRGVDISTGGINQQNPSPPSATLRPFGGVASFPRIKFTPPPTMIGSISEQHPPPPIYSKQLLISPAEQNNGTATKLVVIEMPRSNRRTMPGSKQQQLREQLMPPAIPDPQLVEELNPANMFAQQQQQQQSQPLEEERPKTFVEGDFQPGVWNGSALQQQQQNNPYAEEWFPQYGEGQQQQQVEQNNMVQEGEGEQQPQQQQKPPAGVQQRWNPSYGSPFSQHKQQVEQRRAVKDGEIENNGQQGTAEVPQQQQEVGKTTEPSAAAAESIAGGDVTPSPAPEGTTTGQPLVGEAQQQQMAITTTTTDESIMQQTVQQQQSQQLTMNSSTNSNPERNSEGGDPGSEGTVPAAGQSSAVGNDSLGDQQQQQSHFGTTVNQQEGQVQTIAGHEQPQNNRISPMSADSVEEEKQLDMQMASLKEAGDKAGGQVEAEEEPAGQRLKMAENSEEQEQRAILRRLYNKYGSNASDLLRRVENLLLLAEDGILSVKKSEGGEAPATTIGDNDQQRSPEPAEQQIKKKRREARGRGELIRRYLKRMLADDGGTTISGG